VISDLIIGMNNEPFELSVELDWREIDKNISVSDSGGNIILHSADVDFEMMDWKLYLSPRLIFTAIINGIATYPESVYAAINEQKRDISSDILDAIREILGMETYYPGAWEPFSSDFQIKIAKQEYAKFFQRCGDFSLDQLRWKITRNGIEIRDCVVCELFDEFSEWRNNYYNSADEFGNDDEDYELYLEELQEGSWPVKYVTLYAKLTLTR
jgi:hypothetical protein